MKANNRTAGLALGPAVRSQRSELRRKLNGRALDLAALLKGELPGAEEIALGMQAGALLSAWFDGDLIVVARVLGRAGVVDAGIRLGDLTIDRRRQLAAELQKEAA